jgi:hypothetical protein
MRAPGDPPAFWEPVAALVLILVLDAAVYAAIVATLFVLLYIVALLKGFQEPDRTTVSLTLALMAGSAVFLKVIASV